MRALRLLGNAILWLVAVVGVLSMLVWGATRLGYIKPLVVISGSMEPKIMTGDLLVDVPHKTAHAHVGEVASIPSAVTGKVISHRIVAIEQAADGTWHVNLKGDANESADAETYAVGDTVWQPALTVPGGGYAVTKLTERGVVVPLGIALLALIGIVLVPSAAPSPRPARHDGPDGTGDASAEAQGPDDPPTGLADDEPAPAAFPDRIADLSAARRS
jgi:signal peptidase